MQNSGAICNAVLYFPSRSNSYLENVLFRLPIAYKMSSWGSIGPSLVTNIFREFTKSNKPREFLSTEINLFKPNYFYAIYYPYLDKLRLKSNYNKAHTIN